MNDVYTQGLWEDQGNLDRLRSLEDSRMSAQHDLVDAMDDLKFYQDKVRELTRIVATLSECVDDAQIAVNLDKMEF
tara:strand:- start:902 stop:1129 length:228 start_codon:yes stop_codon:yes gene_type:complete